VDGVCRHPDDLGSLGNDGVYTAVDADAPVAGSLARLVGEPVVAVAAPQHLHDGHTELFQLDIATSMLPSDEVN